MDEDYKENLIKMFVDYYYAPNYVFNERWEKFFEELETEFSLAHPRISYNLTDMVVWKLSKEFYADRTKISE